MITLYQFPAIWGLPNASPFCLKLETYLRMAELPYEIKKVRNPARAPKGKLPFIKLDNQLVADSDIIIDYLKARFGDKLDKKLTREHLSLSSLVSSSLSGELYWQMLYMRWKDDKAWVHVKKAFFRGLPFYLKGLVPYLARKRMINSLEVQGTGRLTEHEVLHQGYKIIDALAVLMGNQKFFHGEQPTSIDATIFGFLANIAWVPFEDPFKLHLQQHKNLLGYCERMWNSFYPEMPKPFI